MNKNIVKISQILYFLLFFIAVSFAIVYQFSNDSQVHINIVLLFLLLLLPFFDYIYGEFIQDFLLRCKKLSKTESIVFFCCFFLLLGLFNYIDVSPWIYSIIALICFSFLRFDPRLLFLGALMMFLCVAFYLIFGDSQKAEQFSIFAYYFLIAGVAQSIFESVFFSNKQQ